MLGNLVKEQQKDLIRSYNAMKARGNGGRNLPFKHFSIYVCIHQRLTIIDNRTRGLIDVDLCFAQVMIHTPDWGTWVGIFDIVETDLYQQCSKGFRRVTDLP